MRILLLIVITSIIHNVTAIEAEVKSISGKPTLVLDGKMHPTMMMIASNPLFSRCVKNCTLDINSPDAGSVWRVYTKRKFPAEMTIMADVMMKSPTGPDAGALLRFRRCGGEFLIGLNCSGNNRYIKITGSRVGINNKSISYTVPFKWKLNHYYRFIIKFSRKKLTVELDKTNFKKEILLAKPPTAGVVGLTAFRCNAIYRPLKIIDLKGNIIMKEIWFDKNLPNWQPTGDFESLVKYSKAGIDIFQVALDSSGCFKGPEKYDFDVFKQRCQEVLTQNPKAKIVARMRLDLPMWYQSNDIKVTNKDITGKKIKRYPWSFSSPEWRELLKRYVISAVEYIDKHDFGKNVIGFLLMSGNGGEFVYHFSNMDFSNYSESHRCAYINYLKNKYSNNINRLNSAWGTKLNSFADIKLPTPKERVHFKSWKNFGYTPKPSEIPATGHGQTTFFPNNIRTRLNDFLRFNSLNIIDFIKVIAESIKKNSSQKRIIGVYYGYVVPAKSNSFNKGHNALKELLKYPEIDFLASPYGYMNRFAGGPATMQLPCASARVNGKLALLEDDTRTVFCLPHESMGLQVKTLKKTLGVLKRNFTKALQNNAGIWFLDFGSKWFSPGPIPALVKEMKKIYNIDLTKIERARNVETVVLLSDKSYDYMYRTSDFVKPLIYKQITGGLARMGAPFDVALVSDISKLDNYKFYIFLNTFYLAQAEREAIKSVVKRNGKTALWIYAPGYISEKGLSVRGMSDLTGINLKIEKLNARLKLIMPQAKYIFPKKIAPVIFADDSNAEKLGNMELSEINNDSGENVKKKLIRPGMVKKTFKNWTSIYCSVPNINYKVMNHLAKEAGVHVYNDEGNIITVGPWWVGMHVVSDGDTTIKLPKYNLTIKELFTNTKKSISSKNFVVKAQGGETYFWLVPNM